jgi:hypothetical protein
LRPGLALNENWELVANASGPPTFMRKGRRNNNALQISKAINKDGKPLVPEPDVEKIAEASVARFGGKPTRIFSGVCHFGKFGSAVFAVNNFAHCQIWSITDGVHFLTATFICDSSPAAEELSEVEKMVMSLTLVAS